MIKIPTLELQERTLVCEYNILTDDISEQRAHSLITNVLLDDYCDGYYQDKADKIQLSYQSAVYALSRSNLRARIGGMG